MNLLNPQIILVLPAYNEEENLTPLLYEAREAFDGAGFVDWRVVVVNDGSTDHTGEVLRSLVDKLGERVVVVTHPANRGLGEAIMTGLKSAANIARQDSDVIVCMDADNTHSPAYVPEMVSKIAAGFDVVIASRYRQGSREVGVPLQRRMLSLGARWVFRLMLHLPDVRDYTCGFRAYRFGVVRLAMERYGDELITRKGFACTDELLVKLSKLTSKITEIPFVLRYDKNRSRSQLPLMRTVWETVKMLVTAK